MKRFWFENDGLRLSYMDSEGTRPVLIAMHATWMEGATFVPLAEGLGAEWRGVVAPDQRGHGFSDHANAYGREDYLADLDVLFDHLHVSEAVLFGNSLGGVNAYQYAARRPERVSALIIEDIGVEIGDDVPPSLKCPRSAARFHEQHLTAVHSREIGKDRQPTPPAVFRPCL